MMDENPNVAPKTRSRRRGGNHFRVGLYVIGALLVAIALTCAVGVLSERNTGARESYIRHAYMWGASICGLIGAGAIAMARRN